MEALDQLVVVEIVDDIVVVDELVGVVLHKYLVDQIEGIDGLQQLVPASLVELADKGLGSIEEHTLLEGWRPKHLHLHQELTSHDVFAPYVHDTILAHIVVGNQFGREILHLLHQLVFLERQQGVEQADEQILMLAKYLLEGQIGLGIEILFMRCTSCFDEFTCKLTTFSSQNQRI